MCSLYYAHDANLLVSAPSVDQVEILSFTELANILEYLKQHHIILNIEKTNLISFKTSRCKRENEQLIMIDSEQIAIQIFRFTY